MPDVLTITGDPDDPTVWVEGDINEAFTLLDNVDESLLAFSDGTVLAVSWSELGWRITAEQTGTATLSIIDAAGVAVATLDGDIRWVVFGVICVPIP